MSRTVHLWPTQIEIPAAGTVPIMRGHVAVVIDVLRATTTMTHALAAGVRRLAPILAPIDEAPARGEVLKRQLMSEGHASHMIVLGGERRGVKIEGFDLGNSPTDYTRESVGGRTLLFTTTNGTEAIRTCEGAGAARILFGCLNNLAAMLEVLDRDGRDVHMVCAGTRGRVSMEDVLCGGALAAMLADRGWSLGLNAEELAAWLGSAAWPRGLGDEARIAAAMWRGVAGAPMGIHALVADSIGGRNLQRIGLHGDIEVCAQVSTHAQVGELDARDAALPEIRVVD